MHRIRTIALFLCIILFVHVYWTVHNDVQWQVANEKWESRKKIAQCKQNYIDNRCDERSRPALIEKCDEWWHCAELDLHPSVHQVASLYAQSLAHVLNSFIQALTFKTTVVLMLLIILTGFLARF